MSLRKVSLKIFRLAGILTLPYLCDMGDISSSRSSNIFNSYIGRFYTDDALSLWTNLIKHFVVRLVMRLYYKDGHKTHYASRRTTFRSASFKTYCEGKFVQTHNTSCARLYA